MNVPTDLDALNLLVCDRDNMHVWILEFGLTHSVLRLAVHPGTYPRHVELICSDCVRLEGDIQGGPYLLEFRHTDWHGDEMVELRSSDGSFRVVCGAILQTAGRQ